MTIRFEVNQIWENDHPGALAGVLALSGVSQPRTCKELDEATTRIEQDLRVSLNSRSEIKALPVVESYNTYYKLFHSNYTLVPQVESIALKGRPIPRFLPLVQAMFTAELKNLLLTAGHDLAKVKGRVRLLSASGTETYIRMDGKKQQLKQRDMYMADDLGIISAVIPGPDQRSKITALTNEVLFAVYVAPGIKSELLEAHLNDLESYVRMLDPGAETILKEIHQA